MIKIKQLLNKKDKLNISIFGILRFLNKNINYIKCESGYGKNYRDMLFPIYKLNFFIDFFSIKIEDYNNYFSIIIKYNYKEIFKKSYYKDKIIIRSIKKYIDLLEEYLIHKEYYTEKRNIQELFINYLN